MITKYKSKFAEVIAPFFWKAPDELIALIQLAPENVIWDFAFPCFQFAKNMQKAPNIIAQDLEEFLNDKTSDYFSWFKAVWPYVNACLNVEYLAKQIITEVNERRSEYWKAPSTWKTMLLEWWAPNTHKSIHIWHVRNFLLSESISRLLAFAWNKVIKTCYPWDIWAHVAKWLWYYMNFSNQEFPKENFTKWVWNIYTLATQEIEKNPDLYKPQVEKLQKDLEDWDEQLVALWKETRELCLQDMKHIFAELWTEHLDKWYYESEVEKPWIKIVNDLLERGIAKKSQGAVVMDLEEFDLWVFLLLKSTWASLYSTKDIALAYQKKQDFPEYDKSLYVVGLEQEHHFQQLFKTLELIWFDYDKLKHVSYALVSLSEGKMASRLGNIVLYEDFRDDLLAKAKEMVAWRDLPEDEKEKIAHDVAFAAMKFSMLLQDSEKGIIFDRDQALSFEGETGPYLQYMYARMCSIFKKAGDVKWNVDYSLLTTDAEKSLLLLLAGFPWIVLKSAEEFKPNGIARFALNLAKEFSSYYHQSKILDDENEDLMATRLSLLHALQQTLKNALTILGIETPESM